MRVATYVIPAARGAGEAECAVYHFGPGQGGGTDANLERWIGEFTTTSRPPDRSSWNVDALTVSRVRVRGAYASHAGGMGAGEAGGAQPDHELLGAIVEGPAGSVYFKLTGPAATVDAAARDFDALLGSVRRK
jgi:hypothetical protein